MRELRWPLLIFVICLPVIVLASGVKWPWQDDTPTATPLPVPAGDREIAWIHTTTNANTWERFVTGVMRTPMTVAGLHVDDSRAFPETTTAIPELVLSRDGHAGHVRIRWYKLQNQIGHREWVNALAGRAPAPLAVIGGGSTTRALDLARAMEEQTGWRGDRPPLLISTATADYDAADDLAHPVRLVDIYKGHTFRFCYSNRAMAQAVVDFVYKHAELKLTPVPPPGQPVRALLVTWSDDQYSIDLQAQFMAAMGKGRPTTFDPWGVAFSVGGYLSPNAIEERTAQQIAAHLERVKDERVLLVLPSTTQPARRLLQAILDTDPTAAGRLVVVTGDGIPVNAVLRDGEFAWPVGAVPVPLVLFAHSNPVDWDDAAPARAPSAGYEFRRPNGTEEANHFGKMAQILAEECFPADRATPAGGGQLVKRLKSLSPAFFDRNGERIEGTGEHVVVVRPPPAPTLQVWKRDGTKWETVCPPVELKLRDP